MAGAAEQARRQRALSVFAQQQAAQREAEIAAAVAPWQERAAALEDELTELRRWQTEDIATVQMIYEFEQQRAYAAEQRMAHMAGAVQTAEAYRLDMLHITDRLATALKNLVEKDAYIQQYAPSLIAEAQAALVAYYHTLQEGTNDDR